MNDLRCQRVLLEAIKVLGNLGENSRKEVATGMDGEYLKISI
jgi:hypothetical protein